MLELGNFIAGPFAGQLFGDYGAEVIKVEAPDGGDPMRHWGVTRRRLEPVVADHRPQQAIGGRRPEGSARTSRSCNDWPPSAMSCSRTSGPVCSPEFGLDHATLSARNPGIIVTHVSGFGQTGPRASEAGFGSIGEAVGGIRHTTGDPDRPPARCGISLGDSLAAMFAVIGTLAALHERAVSGRGQEVDVAIYEAVAALMESSMVDFEVGGVLRGRSGGTLPGVAPANAYPTRDGSEVLIAGNADTVFTRLCAAMGRAGPRHR